MTIQKNKSHILFLFSDTGGGHRSAAEAIIEAIDLEFPQQFSYEMVDFFLNYAPPPLNLAGPTYPAMSRMDYLWGRVFETSDDPDRMRVVYAMLWPYIRLYMYKLHREHPADVIVSVHPLINTPFLRAKRKRQDNTPYITVVTDLVSTHTAWFNNQANLIIVPTEQARQNAISFCIEPEKLQVIGLPVADRFSRPTASKQEMREKLGWPQDKMVILLVGGGEGMGPLGEVSMNVNDAKLDAALVVVTGRNKHLKEKLEKHTWNIPAFIYGFVTDMPDFMRAADVLVSKAGPGTISEALIAELPIILYHRISGQEEGNVSYVIDEGAGIWAPEIDDIVLALKEWLDYPELRLQAVENAKRLARPDASRQIARAIAAQVKR
jgi:1,2-diacylglycerol 3-beta-galactosyltransferase